MSRNSAGRFGIKWVLTVLVLCCCTLVQGALQLAKNGKPAAEIVLSTKGNITLDFAASELQLWIREISGAELPIVGAENPEKAQIVLTVQDKRFPADLKKLAGKDGFAIRQKGKQLFIIGSCVKGVLNGVFRLLYWNSDIIWARPNPEFGTIYSKDPNLTLTKTDAIDIPVFALRGWQMSRKGESDANLWQVRNNCNWCFGSMAEKRKYGNILEYGGGHNIVNLYIREKKYFASHPEFFPMRKGKRVKYSDHRGGVQLCFTNQEMVQAFIKEVDAKIKENPDYTTYRIMIEDNHNTCECPVCQTPIKLPNGKVVTPKDKNFNSTRFFLFLNQIARHFKKNYPGKRILTFAYFFTIHPPACTVEDNIDISFCPISKNSKLKLTDAGSKKTLDQFHGWAKVAKNITWREYFGLCGDFPKPIDAVALADWRYVLKHGVSRTYSEMRSDIRIGADLTPAWDANSMYFWVITQGAWNPNRDLQSLRMEYLTRVYGAEAAPDVAEYYRLIEEQWFKLPGRFIWNAVSWVMWKQHVIRTGIIPKCRAALKRAEGKVTTVKGKKMLAALRGNFEAYVGLAENKKVVAPKADAAPAFDPDFASGEWKKAKAATEFNWNTSLRRHPENTELRMLYDNKNIYIGIKCDYKDVKNMRYRKPAKGDVFPHGEGFEVILTGNWKGSNNFMQMVVDPSNNRSRGGRKTKWTSVAKVTGKGWSAMITVPWSSLNYKKGVPAQVRGQFIRHFNFNQQVGRPSWRTAILFSGVRRRSIEFCKVIFDK